MILAYVFAPINFKMKFFLYYEKIYENMCAYYS